MDSQNKRRFPRTRLRAIVKLTHPEVGSHTSQTRDISEGGAFVFTDGMATPPRLGDIVQVQVQGLPGEDAPVVPMRVVHIEEEGIGLEFLPDDEF